MSGTPRKYVGGLAVGTLVLQEGAGFEDGPPGQFDEGQKTFLTHCDTPRSKWPQRGERDATYIGMKVHKVVDRMLDCGLIELTVAYRGAIRGDQKPDLISQGADTQMLTLPARSGSSSGPAATMIAPVPVPTCSRELIVFVEPTTAGVGLPAVAEFLLAPPAFSLTFYADPDQPLTLNYFANQWILQSRNWDNSTPNVWLVRERYAYFYAISV